MQYSIHDESPEINFEEIDENEDDDAEDNRKLFRLSRLDKLKPFTSTPVVERSFFGKDAAKKNLFSDMGNLTPFKGSTAVKVSSEAIESPFLFRAKKKPNSKGSPIIVQDPFKRALLASHFNAQKENLRKENFQLSSQIPLSSQSNANAKRVVNDPFKKALLKHLNDTNSPSNKQIVKRIPITGKRLEELKRLRQDSSIIDDPIKKRLKLAK